MSSLSREVLKWLQSLDLTWQIKNPKWDFSNGYLIAEILSWYFPREIHMNAFYNRHSFEMKKKNWYILKNFILRNQFEVSMESIEGTFNCREGAAVQVIEKLYEILSNRRVRKPLQQTDYGKRFSDYVYQLNLPMYQRPTLSKAIKNNLRYSEILADQTLALGKPKEDWVSDRIILKAQMIANDHLQHRQDERRKNPTRFGITLSDRYSRYSGLEKNLHREPGHLRRITDQQSELKWKIIWSKYPAFLKEDP